MAINKINTEAEIVPPHSSNYIRALVNNLTKKLRLGDSAITEVPTLLSIAKTLVNRDSYIVLFTTKEDD